MASSWLLDPSFAATLRCSSQELRLVYMVNWILAYLRVPLSEPEVTLGVKVCCKEGKSQACARFAGGGTGELLALADVLVKLALGRKGIGFSSVRGLLFLRAVPTLLSRLRGPTHRWQDD